MVLFCFVCLVGELVYFFGVLWGEGWFFLDSGSGRYLFSRELRSIYCVLGRCCILGMGWRKRCIFFLFLWYFILGVRDGF